MIKVIQGDITQLQTDAIVNAANTSLLGGGGVDGAIHRVGGESILEECLKIRNKQGGCKVGEAVITTAGNLPARFVIHTVGPIWKGGNNDEDKLLFSAYTNSLKLAIENNLQTIAFPNISTGVYNFPKQRAANIALSTVLDFMQQHSTIKEVIYVCFDEENFDIYSSLIDKLILDSELERFLEAQANNYSNALNEIKNERKTGHWMWYIYPQLAGLGFSGMSKKYAIRGLFEAECYLSHEVLGKRLIEISEALLNIKGNTAFEIFQSPDDIKLKSCMTLFSLLNNTHPVFELVLEKYFEGNKCFKTLELLETE